MKIILILIPILMLYSCTQYGTKASYVTEAYIKTNLQKHTKEEVSSISIRNKYKFFINDEIELIEINFVDYNDKSYFVITCHETENQKSNILILNKDECKKLLPKIVEIVFNAQSTPAIIHNIDYFDYAVREDVFFSATNNLGDEFQSSSKGQAYLFLWFNQSKFRLSYNNLIKILEEFNSISR